MTAPAEVVKVVVSDLYSETELVFLGGAHEVLAQLLEVFAWLRPSAPTVLASNTWWRSSPVSSASARRSTS